MIQHPVMVIAMSQNQSLIGFINIPAQGFHLCKVHGRSLYRQDLSRGDGYFICRSEP